MWNFREAIEADMAALHDDKANLWAVFQARDDDVEKGEGGKKVVKRTFPVSKVAELKRLRSDQLQPSASLPVPTAVPSLSRQTRLSEKEKAAAESQIMMDMVLGGHKMDVVTSLLAQKQFVDKQAAAERRKKIIERNRWLYAGFR
ncbi:hypothetical protein OROMI_029050 [Orobanche minor]